MEAFRLSKPALMSRMRVETLRPWCCRVLTVSTSETAGSNNERARRSHIGCDTQAFVTWRLRSNGMQ